MKKINNKGVDRMSETNKNNFGSIMTIVEYNNANDIVVEFENGYRLHTTYSNFKKGNVKNLYDKTICDVGFIGDGDYKVSINGKHTIQYKYWNHMLKRCYNPKSLVKNPTYNDKVVCEEWHNFQSFAKWFNDNYYEIDSDIMCLDKDILFKGNKIYSPETCVFVPNRINCLFTKCDKSRGGFPVGVSYRKDVKKFRARCDIYDNEIKKSKIISLGTFKTPEEAFNIYKEFKEDYIKQVADEYKDKIPQKLYEAMYEYEVEITD